MDKLKKDTLKVGDTFKISYTPRTHNSEIIDVVDDSQLQPIFRNATWNDDCQIGKPTGLIQCIGNCSLQTIRAMFCRKSIPSLADLRLSPMLSQIRLAR